MQPAIYFLTSVLFLQASIFFAELHAQNVPPAVQSLVDRLGIEGHWDTRFGPGPGVDGLVTCQLVMGNDLYVGGSFSKAGEKNVRNLARWDGKRWHDVGFGVDGPVEALAVFNGELYVGGRFEHAGFITTSNIARWNGTAWSAVQGGCAGDTTMAPGVFVSTLAADDQQLYVGGSFQSAGEVGATNIAAWDGTNWSSMGGSIDGWFPMVLAIGIADGYVYAGGSFESAGGVAATNIARWDGFEWSALAVGVSGGGYLVNPQSGGYISANVRSIVPYGDKLFVGGVFTLAGGRSVTNLAVWDEFLAQWGGTGVGFDESVNAIVPWQGQLYVGGSFSRVGDLAANGIVRWDGKTLVALTNSVEALPDSPLSIPAGIKWESVGPGTSGSVYSLQPFGANLYIGGEFAAAGNRSAGSFARWNGKRWSTIGVGGGQPLLGVPFVATAKDGELNIAGDLISAGRVRANKAVVWDGSKWRTLGNTVRGVGYTAAGGGNDYYLGGNFSIDGGQSGMIVHWDGQKWSQAPGLTVPPDYRLMVEKLAYSGDRLYAFGWALSIEATGEPAQLVCRTRTDWSVVPMPQADYGLNISSTLLAEGTNLYAQLDRVEGPYGVPVESWFERWDGSVWSPLGGVVLSAHGQVPAIRDACIHGQDLYICGTFTSIGAVAVTNLAHWNGTEWAPVGNAFDSSDSAVNAVAASDRGVYVGGSFATIGGVPVQSIARWNGRRWSSMNGGIDGEVFDLAVSGRKVCAIGLFSHAGKAPSKNFAIWNEVK